MPVVNLTKRTIDAQRPRERPYIAFDRSLKGFGVRVLPSGSKSFVIEYRPHGGGRAVGKRRLKLGSVGELTADQARTLARQQLSKVRLGADPAGERSAARRQMLMAAAVESFLADHADAKLKPKTVDLYSMLLRRYVVPKLGTRKVDTVTRSDVTKLHLAMRDRPYQANRLIAVVATLYSYLAREHVVPEGFNPVRGIAPFPEARRERFLTSDELDRLGTALRQAETVGLPWQVDTGKPGAKHLAKEERRITKVSTYATNAIRLLLLTGCRLREVLWLKWEYIDFERGLLFLPDSKTGRKTVVLNAPAVKLLTELPRIGDYVIPGEPGQDGKSRPRADLKRPWLAIRRAAKLDGLRLHDLRHTHASFGIGGGLSLAVIGKLLGHRRLTTTQRYAHLDIDPLRVGSEQIGTKIVAALDKSGPPPSKTAEVVPMKRGLQPSKRAHEKSERGRAGSRAPA
jgi:integrase